MPILSMLEQIRCQLMSRICSKQKEALEKWIRSLCPKIQKRLNKNAKYAANCFTLAAGNGVYQVTSAENKYVVELELKSCDCRRWQLSGIPCSHAIACLREEMINPEERVASCFKIERYMKAYGYNIHPLRDTPHWDKMNGVPVAPPIYKNRAGRVRRNRKKTPEEIGKRKLSKTGVTMHCSICHRADHNKKGHHMYVNTPQGQPMMDISSEDDDYEVNHLLVISVNT